MIKNTRNNKLQEEEKNRILEMHKSATKNQYLKESILMEQPYFLEPVEVFQIQNILELRECHGIIEAVMD